MPGDDRAYNHLDPACVVTARAILEVQGPPAPKLDLDVRLNLAEGVRVGAPFRLNPVSLDAGAHVLAVSSFQVLACP